MVAGTTFSQELERLHHENEDLQMQFFQQGKELISRNKQSLAAEMENASKEEVCVCYFIVCTERLGLCAYAICLEHSLGPKGLLKKV